MGQMLDSLLRKSFQSSKCKSLLEQAISRIDLLKSNREIQCEILRMDVAELLQKGQEAGARCRVEHVFKEQNIVDAYLLIEEFCTAVIDKMESIEKQKTCPSDLKEAISSLCFAASRCTDLPELQQVRSLFSAKYGKEFTKSASELIPGCTVSKQIIEKLSTRAPSRNIKSKLIQDIAALNAMEWKFESLANEPNCFLEARHANLQSAHAARHSSARENPKSSRELDKMSMPLRTDCGVTQPDSVAYSSPPSPAIPFLDDDMSKDDKPSVSLAKKGFGKLFKAENYDSQHPCPPPFDRKKESAVYPKPAGDPDSESSEDEAYTRPRMGGKTVCHTGTKTLNSIAPNDPHRSAKFSEVHGFSVGSLHEKIKYTDAASAAEAAFKSAARAAAAARAAVSLATSESNKYSSQTTDYSSEASSECDDGIDETLLGEKHEDTHPEFIHGLERDIDEITSVRYGAYKINQGHQYEYYDCGEECESNDVPERIKAHVKQERIEPNWKRSMAMPRDESNLTNQSFPFKVCDRDEHSSVRSGYQNTLKGRGRWSENEDLTRSSSAYSPANLPQLCCYCEPDTYVNFFNRKPYQKKDYIHETERTPYRSKSQMRLRPGMNFKVECGSPRSQRSISTSRLSKPSSNRDFFRLDDSERTKFHYNSKIPMPRRSQPEDDYSNDKAYQFVRSIYSGFPNSDSEAGGAGKLIWRSNNLEPVNQEHPRIDLTRLPKSHRSGRNLNLIKEQHSDTSTNSHAAIPAPPRLFHSATGSLLHSTDPTPISANAIR